ncbi:MAG TPA: alkaline phosphatase family protein [Gemmatimonadales bacterium]|nr:alkaline phosphatase family protein [Gemmatimonadales bacterium]
MKFHSIGQLGRGLILLLLCVAPAAGAQAPAPGPRLVVVIAIDQFRPDYLQRFRRYFSPGGFNLLLGRGATFVEAHYQHGVTQTCPGHAVILTGSSANVNGITANYWFNLAQRREEYCAADSAATLIGTAGEGRSPRNLRDSTVGDRLKQATGGRSRVVTVAGKDRSAIMLGGHLADAAYWSEDTLIVTSSYYMKELPAWVQRFNRSRAISRYRGSTWSHLLPAAAYRLVGRDNVAAEENPGGMGRTFPHRLSAGRTSLGNFIKGFEASPFENEMLVRFAMELVQQEQLGRDDDPDLLAIGFSANDAVGHSYGPDSHEVMDMTVRTDRELARLFGFLDRQIGMDRVLVVLTADHGVAPLPEVVRQRNPAVQAARINPAIIASAAEEALRVRYGEPRAPAWMTPPAWIMYPKWPWMHLNLPGLEDRGIPVEEAERIAQEAIRSMPGVAQVLTGTELRESRRTGAHSRAELSFDPERSGQLYYAFSPYLVPGPDADGTDHGSPWTYDTHVPLLWFGPGIAPGVHQDPVSVGDIAPTLSALLGLDPPGGSQGRVLREMLLPGGLDNHGDALTDPNAHGR